MDWFGTLSRGDWISIIGLVVSCLGFGVTLWQVGRSRDAANSARDAAQEAKKNIRILNVVSDVSAAESAIRDLEKMNRDHSWDRMPEKMADLRRLLTEMNANRRRATAEKDEIDLLGCISFFQETEYSVNDLWRRKDKLGMKHFQQMEKNVSVHLHKAYLAVLAVKDEAKGL